MLACAVDLAEAVVAVAIALVVSVGAGIVVATGAVTATDAIGAGVDVAGSGVIGFWRVATNPTPATTRSPTPAASIHVRRGGLGVT